MDAYQGFDVDDRPKFNVAIIYEDGAAGKAFLRSSDSGARRRMRLQLGTLELPGARGPADWKFGGGSRRTGRLCDYLNAPQSSAFYPD